MQHTDSSAPSLEYGQQSPRVSSRRLARPALLVLALLAIPVVLWILTIGYVDRHWRSLTPGMTRAQVDQKLWAFARSPNPKYGGLFPGQFVIRYELFRMGGWTTIQIVFNADGTLDEAQPVYDV